MFSVIFPGQGSQIIGMGIEFFEKHNLVKELFQEADDVLGINLTKIILEGPKDKLDLTANTQPAIFLISYSIFNVVKKEYKIDLNQLYIVVDDMDIPLGKIRFRKKGSSGGHNGLKSIIEQLNTENFNRIRVGIGSPTSQNKQKALNTISFVLGNISIEENLILEKVFKQVILSLEKLSTKKEDLIISELNSFNNENI